MTNTKDMKLWQWRMTAPKSDLQLVASELPAIGAHQALVQVAGCGVCHTDLGFWHDGVRTKMELPLTLGHEISGTVVAGPAHLLHKPVIVPAVLPCGECDLCAQGRSNICRKQLMPGNDLHGGFASHIAVPHRYLCPVPPAMLEKYPLAHLAVIADAISTPYQVVKRAGIAQGDLAIVIGVGGVGIYGAMIARLMGAKVLAIDISDEKLALAKRHGVDAVLNSKGMDLKAVKERVRAIAEELRAPKHGWKIFEISGTTPGQDLAFNLITYASTLSVVGFTMNKVEVRLSNLMAFDAQLIGTWGCKPELYPEVVDLIASGKLDIGEFVEAFPMSKINEVFRDSVARPHTRRPVMVPDMPN
jgi:6-hydroxycyclohex-1-ene-1-carbonyl-CoA dehydrogenase